MTVPLWRHNLYLTIQFLCIILLVLKVWSLQDNVDIQKKQNAELMEYNSYLLQQDKCIEVPLDNPDKQILVKPNVKMDKIRKFFSKTEYAPVTDILITMAVKETGYFKSQQHLEYNNLFSTTRKPLNPDECKKGKRTDCLMIHVSEIDCLKTVLGTLRKRGYSTDPKEFLLDLKRNGWAEDKKYIDGIVKTMKSLKKRGYITTTINLDS